MANILTVFVEFFGGLPKWITVPIGSFIILMCVLTTFIFVDANFISKSPSYAFGLKFGPEEKEKRVNRKDYYQYDKSESQTVKYYIAPINWLSMTTEECLTFGTEQLKKYGFKKITPGGEYLYGLSSPHSELEFSIVIRCAEYEVGGVSDVQIFGVALSETVRTFAKAIDKAYETKFSRANVKLEWNN